MAAKSKATPTVTEDMVPATPVRPRGRGRPPGSKNKVKPVKSDDVRVLLKTMVDDSVKTQLGGSIKEPVLAPTRQRLTPSQTQREGQVQLLYDNQGSIYTVPNPRPDLFYYWVCTHPFAQHKAQMDGFTFVVGEEECKKLGYDARLFLNSRSRIQIFDMELATQPKDLADRKRAYFNKKTQDRLTETLDKSNEILARAGKPEIRKDSSTMEIIKKGAEEYVAARE